MKWESLLCLSTYRFITLDDFPGKLCFHTKHLCNSQVLVDNLPLFVRCLPKSRSDAGRTPVVRNDVLSRQQADDMISAERGSCFVVYSMSKLWRVLYSPCWVALVNWRVISSAKCRQIFAQKLNKKKEEVGREREREEGREKRRWKEGIREKQKGKVRVQ